MGARTRFIIIGLRTRSGRHSFFPPSSLVSTRKPDATQVLHCHSGTRLCYRPCSSLDSCCTQTTRVGLRSIPTDYYSISPFVISHRNAVYKKPNAPIEGRIRGLIPMTLEEKVARLNQGDISDWVNMSDPLDNTLVHDRTGQSIFTDTG